MNEIPRKKVEELLKQAGFSEQEIKGVALESSSPIPVMEVSDMPLYENMEPGEKFPLLRGRESQGSIYQCMFFGKVLGAKRWIKVCIDGFCWELKRFEVVVYQRDSSGDWNKVIIVEQLGEDGSEIYPFKFSPGEKDFPELREINKVAKFIKLLVGEEG